jgi:carbonic anhydrase/acetyltransferase-like protein (isoleucine patch superfamily)
MRSVDRILKGAKPADLANAVVFDGARVGTGALVAAGSVVYPKTRIAPRTVFRNSASGNHPTIEPVGRRMLAGDVVRADRRDVPVRSRQRRAGQSPETVAGARPRRSYEVRYHEV